MSDFTTRQELISSLVSNARVQDSEGFKSPSDYVDLIRDAVSQHNASYQVSETVCTVPSRESYPVVLLAWSMLCFVRASKFASDPSTSQGGFSTDRNSPFQKCLTLAKELRNQYSLVCQSLALSTYAGTGSVVQSEVVSESHDLGAMTPIELSLDPPPIILITDPSTKVNNDGTLLVKWTQDLFENFAAYYVISMEGPNAIFQDWNFGSKSTIPRLNDEAVIVGRLTDQTVKQVKITDLTKTVGTVSHFLIACASKSGKWSYSNEVVLTQPA
jgi:hypothetical protein